MLVIIHLPNGNKEFMEEDPLEILMKWAISLIYDS